MAADARWARDHIVVKERRLTLGRQYRILAPDGQLLAYCKQKMFRLREDIRFYADESQNTELFRLATRKIIDFNANFDVIDSSSGKPLGSLRRKGWRSLVRDKWEVADASGNPLATLEEDSLSLALVRRLVLSFLPMKYVLTTADGRDVGTIRERFQLFGDTYDVRTAGDHGLDPRILVGLAVCIDALEEE